MINPKEVYKIGYISKIHGIKGEVVMRFDDDVFDRNDADFLFLKIDGLHIPFFIEEYRFKNDETAFIKFCDIETEDQATELIGCEVCFPVDERDADNQSPNHQLDGFEVIDFATQKSIGTIKSIDNQTTNVLFELDNGKLIPANSDFIEHVDEQKKEITLHLPNGLLEL